ncbi:unnamed protein product [Adineta steineri]|uniref:B box-type domain-containing protein n=1 Tax=Adineta steineri TaxID=433720 RepID=A0A815BNC0_9BILA|nr:unnamed protein product [Adineta steineri]CAF1272140.1 unnamed protein product [Adineta steineri]
MATANTRAKCSICNKANATCLCSGCSKDFCFQHLTEHRQILDKQLNEIINDHDQFQQTIIEQKQNPSNSSLIQQINQWETDSIDQIQQTAEECRKTLTNLTQKSISDIEKTFIELSQKLKETHEENEFNEIDLNHFQLKLTQITEEFNEPSNISIRQDSEEFIKKISVLSTSSNYTPKNPYGFEQTHRTHQPYVNPQGRNADNQQPVYMQSFVPPSPFIHANDPQSMTPFRLVVRPPNEIPIGAPNYMQPTSYLSYPNNNLQQQSTAYPTPHYRPPYHVPQNIPQQTSTTQLSNQTQPSINEQYGTSSQSSQSKEKRIRQPLRIIDPVSQSTLELKTEIPSNDEDRQKDTVVNSTNTTSELSDGTNKTELREDFLRRFARLLASDGQTDRTEKQPTNSVKN